MDMRCGAVMILIQLGRKDCSKTSELLPGAVDLFPSNVTRNKSENDMFAQGRRLTRW